MAYEGIRQAIQLTGVGSQAMRGQIPTAATGGRGAPSNVLKAALAEGIIRPPSAPSGSAVNSGVNNALQPKTEGYPSQSGESSGTGSTFSGVPTSQQQAAPQTFAAAGNGPLDSVMKAMQQKMMADMMKDTASQAAKSVREDKPVDDPKNSFNPRVVQELTKMYNEMNKGMMENFKKLVEELKDPDGKYKDIQDQQYHKDVTSTADNFIKSIEENMNPEGKTFHPKAALDSYDALMGTIKTARETSGNKDLYQDLEKSATEIKDNYIVPMQKLAANNNGAVLHAEDALVKSMDSELKTLSTSDALKEPVQAFRDALAKPGNNNEAINKSFGELEKAFNALPEDAKKEFEADFKEITQAKDLIIRANDIGSIDHTKFKDESAYKAEVEKLGEPFTKDAALYLRQNNPELLEETLAKVKADTPGPSPETRAASLDPSASFLEEEPETPIEEPPPSEVPDELPLDE